MCLLVKACGGYTAIGDVNGGGAGGTGTMYSLQYKACDISLIEGKHYWQSQNSLFSNWDHTNQAVNVPLFTCTMFTKKPFILINGFSFSLQILSNSPYR